MIGFSYMCIAAFSGGILLNLMPCVLPALSIKASSIISHRYESRRNISKAIAYMMGSQMLFLALFAVPALIKTGGEYVGWGYHMQSPITVKILLISMVFCALSASESINTNILNFSWIQKNQRNEIIESFLSGVLAAFFASACVGPFMGVSVVFALSLPVQKGAVIISLLASGFAMPFCLLITIPKFSAILPKPGPWMITFKKSSAFAMMGAAVWAAGLLASMSGGKEMMRSALWLVAGCFFLWGIENIAKSRKNVRKVFFSLFAVSIGAMFLVENNSQYTVKEYNKEELVSALQGKNVVLVNVTADWCITCKTNERLVLKAKEVQDVIKKNRIVRMVADITEDNIEANEYMKTIGRSGVPLYVVHYPDGSKIILSQLITKKSLIEAITKT